MRPAVKVDVVGSEREHRVCIEIQVKAGREALAEAWVEKAIGKTIAERGKKGTSATLVVYATALDRYPAFMGPWMSPRFQLILKMLCRPRPRPQNDADITAELLAGELWRDENEPDDPAG